MRRLLSDLESRLTQAAPRRRHHPLTPRVRHEQILQLYRHSPVALVGMPFSALALAYATAPEFSQGWLVLWLTVIFSLTGLRAALVVYFRRRRPDPLQISGWGRAYTLLELASGITWGVTGAALPALDPLHQVFTSFIFAGMVGGGMAILAPYLPAVSAFVIPAVSLFAFHTLGVPGELGPLMFALTLLYGAVMISVAWFMNHQIHDAIALRFHNDDLVAALQEGNRRLSEEVAERVALAKDLDRSRSELSAILNNMQDTFFRTDREGRLLCATSSLKTLLGISPSEAEQRPVRDFLVDPADEARLLERLHEQGGMVTNHELSLRHRDGHPVWVSVNAQFYYDEEGNVRGLEGTLRDDRERRQALEAAFKAKNDYRRLWEFNRTILDNSPVGIIRLDHRLRIMYMNPEMRRITGVPEGEESAAVGQAIDHLPTVTVSGLSPALRSLKEGREFAITTPYTSLYGKTTYLEALGVPLMDENGFHGAVLVIRDVTEQEEAARALREARDQAEEASRTKSAFLANASHELRTPLTGILGALELLQKDNPGETQRQRLQLAEQAARHLSHLVDDLLLLARGESSGPRWSPVELTRAIHEDTALLANEARGKGLDFQLNLSSELPEVVYVDRQWLRQIITNLVSNAIKFTEKGRIEVCLRVDRYGVDRVYLHLEVSDTGIGIAVKDRERIFEPFTRLEGHEGEIPGTGLGTTIVRELAQRLGGKVWVESEPGRGSRFHVLLALPLHMDIRTPAEPHATLDAPPANALRVLLAEDNAINQAVVQDILTGLGHRVDIAENGRQAVERWQDTRYDVILMDAQMPDLDGLEACREIRRRERREGRARTPIIALTAHAFDDDRRACLDAGMDDYLTKPLSIDELDRALRRICHREGRPHLRLVKN